MTALPPTLPRGPSADRPMASIDDPPLVALVPACDLMLGMHVRIFHGPYGWATVERIRGNEITLARPYVHAPGPMAVHAVTCYIAFERFSISRDGPRTFEVSIETHPLFSRWQAP